MKNQFTIFFSSILQCYFVLSISFFAVANCEQKKDKETQGFLNEDANVLLAGALFFSTYRSNGDGTITDSSIGLTWKICSQGQTYVATSGGYSCEGGGLINNGWGAVQLQYCNQNNGACNAVSLPEALVPVSQIGVAGSSEAYTSCSGDRTGGYSNWRVASYTELKLLSSSSRAEMLLKFPDTIEDLYWSAWANEQDPSNRTARAVSFARDKFGTDDAQNKTNRYYVRCVRP
ncbi:PF07603 family protein [Leptospira fainei serovar Hurstbridge str. BUT 6]|uniref:PF07603 family protein n=1 Tax=Leptospira fainei serovar Hurstbridge str. BUT 6 TaxID=1193011 RepID=S3V1X9_9LEPT|nr:DUF1566 domain-containing protein [Leptospira fainei]EPG74614.1 PF07603 family protein [Leptospira fainei serovar Hurstbridge str. BUT 6]